MGKHWQVIMGWKEKPPVWWGGLAISSTDSADRFHLWIAYFLESVMLNYRFFMLMLFKSVWVNVWFDSMAFPINLLCIWIGILTATNCVGLRFVWGGVVVFFIIAWLSFFDVWFVVFLRCFSNHLLIKWKFKWFPNDGFNFPNDGFCDPFNLCDVLHCVIVLFF